MTSPRTDDFAAVERRLELDRLEREVKFSADPAIRRDARRRYLELTDKETSQ